MESGGGEGEGGSRRKEKGEKRKVSFTLSPYPHPLAVFFFPFHFTWPLPHNQNTKRGQALGQCTRAKKAGVHRKSERAKKGGKKVVLMQLFSFRSPYYLTAYNRLVHFTPMCK